jgi:hypothetical protein
MRKIEQERRATFAGQGQPTAMAIMRVEHDAIGGGGAIPLAC